MYLELSILDTEEKLLNKKDIVFVILETRFGSGRETSTRTHSYKYGWKVQQQHHSNNDKHNNATEEVKQ